MKSPTILALALLFGSAFPLSAQHTYTGDGLWTDIANSAQGVTPPDGGQTIINGTCEIAENIGATNTFNPSRITVGQGTVGVLNVTGGSLSGAHGGNNGIFVGEGAGGDGTVFIAEGASLRSQGGGMDVRIGDNAGGVGKVTVAGELLNFKFFNIINGELEMMPTGINTSFNENNPSRIGADGTLGFVIDGPNVGGLIRANNNGLQLTLDAGANLKITLGGNFALNDSWTLISYGSLVGQFAQGTEFTNDQGYTFQIDYGTGSLDVVTLTLISDAARPVVNSFNANPPSASAGADVDLLWNTANFDALSIDQGIGDVTGQGGMSFVRVNPTETTTYTLSASLGAVTVTQEVTVVVDELPEITSFTTSSDVIAPGDSATLDWDVSGATSVTISELGAVAIQGPQDVMPTETTTYTLTATNATGSVMADVTVTVDAIEAALINQYLAQAPGQSSGSLLDGVGTSNFDVRNGDLRAASASDHTTFTMEVGRANNSATDGGDAGAGYPNGKTFELWVRTGELGLAPQVIFDSGSPADGVAVLIDRVRIRAIQSQAGVRTGDVEVLTGLVNTLDDFIQIVVTLDDANSLLGISARGAAGGMTSASGAGNGAPVGRASLFTWSGFGGAAAGALGGVGDGEFPVNLTTFQGALALLNVYGRVLDETEIEDAFSRWSVDVPVGNSDGDLLPDFWEQRYFNNLDSNESDDNDGEGLDNFGELTFGSDPNVGDTDMDGLEDDEEVAFAQPTDPVDPDTDGDLLTDFEEVNGNPSSDPLIQDTDADSYSDSVEISEGSDPRDPNSLPDAFIGQVPVGVDQTLGTANSMHNRFPGLDVLDATFRLCVDFEEKADGERELIFETGGGGFGISLVYEAGNQLVYRASGSAALGEIFYTLSASEVSGGHQDIVFTYDVDDDNGGSTIKLFVNGLEVGSDSDTLGGDWSGTNNSGLGVVGSGIAGIDGGGDLTGVDLTSASIDLRKGFQFYSGVLFEGAAPPLKLTAVSFDGNTNQLTITWDSVPGTSYSIEQSTDLANGWGEIDDPTADSTTTTRSFSYDPSQDSRVFLRVREL